MKPQVSHHFGESCQVTESGMTEPGLQAGSPTSCRRDLRRNDIQHGHGAHSRHMGTRSAVSWADCRVLRSARIACRVAREACTG